MEVDKQRVLDGAQMCIKGRVSGDAYKAIDSLLRIVPSTRLSSNDATLLRAVFVGLEDQFRGRIAKYSELQQYFAEAAKKSEYRDSENVRNTLNLIANVLDYKFHEEITRENNRRRAVAVEFGGIGLAFVSELSRYNGTGARGMQMFDDAIRRLEESR
jgi:hypothetical protein